MPIGIIHIAAICVGQFKFNTGQRLLRHRIQLSDDNGPGKLVPEGQGLDLTLLDEDTLRRAIQHISLRCFGLPRGDGGAGR